MQNSNKIIWVVLAASLSLGGCSVEKARALQGAAVQFKTESLAAIDAIDQMRQRELEAPPRSQSEIRQGFISRLLNSKVDLNSAVVDLAIDPFKPPNVAEWDDFIVDLRSQYDGFASIFDKLDSGTLISQAEAKQSAEYARTLTVQMALLADAIAKNPPVLGQYRSRTIVKLKKLRQDYQTLLTRLKAREAGISDGNETLQQMNQRKSDLENQAGELMNEWQQIKQEEQKLLETTVAQCTKAATIGKEVVEVANHYDDLEIGQLSALIPRILTTAAAFTGRDYSMVKVKATNLVSQIQSDPLWSGVTKTLLDRANTAAASRAPSQVSLPVSLPPTSRN